MATEGLQQKSLDHPDETRTFENGRAEVVTLGDFMAWAKASRAGYGTSALQSLLLREQVVRSPRYSEASKVRVQASPKKKALQIFSNSQITLLSNSQITLLVLRKHPRKLLMILLYNLANGRVLRACQKKKISNSPRHPVTHQERSRKVLQTSRKGRWPLQKVSF